MLGLEVDLGRLADYFADILENEFDSEIDMDILNAVRCCCSCLQPALSSH